MVKTSCTGFRFLEHTADAYVEASGYSIEEAFSNAAKALFEVMLNSDRVECKMKKLIVDNGIDLYNALYRWLEDLLIIYNVEKLAFSIFKISFNRPINTQEDLLKEVEFLGEACGEPVDREKHEVKNEVKAVTYSLMEILKKNECWVVRFVLDL